MSDSVVSRLAPCLRGVTAIGALLAVASFCLWSVAAAQEQPRLNKIIEAIEAGRPAIANQEWRWIDMEHAPYSASRLAATLAEMDGDRDAEGRFRLTPLIRIPQEGDEDFKWAVKQVLDIGVFGIVMPHVDTKEEAVRFVSAMRYPQTRDTMYPDPAGERGWGPNRAAELWGVPNVTEYHRKADVWPLNPEGELFAVAIIESVEAIENIEAILEAPLSAIMMVPGDTSISMGLGPFIDIDTHPQVEAMYQKVLAACKAQDRVICGCASAAGLQQQRLDEGWQFFLPLGPAPD